MQTENAIRKLEKLGNMEHIGNLYWVKVGKITLSFINNEGTAWCFHTESDDEAPTDITTDHFAGCYHDNLAQAIRALYW
jgi:hypothetical protein